MHLHVLYLMEQNQRGAYAKRKKKENIVSNNRGKLCKAMIYKKIKIQYEQMLKLMNNTE